MSAPPAQCCPLCLGPLAGTVQQAVCTGCRLCADQSRRLWLTLDDACPVGFDYEAVARLDHLGEQNHFWMRERRRLISRLLGRLQGNASGGWLAALELGCGAGLMLPLLEAHARRVVAMDGHRSLLQRAFAASSKTTLLQGDVTHTGLKSGGFDLITAFDVLEHVDADVFLAEARRLAADGAKLLISVPAFPALWSEMDVRAGHRCRYRWPQLKAELVRHGWRPLGHTHFQFLLFPLVYASRRLANKSPLALERSPPPWVDRLLGLVNYFEVAMLNGVSLPFGSSLFAWASLER